MPAPSIEDIFNIGASIMGSSVNDKNNTISMTTGDAVIKEITGPKTQFWQHCGFASRPALAAPGIGAAQSINIVRANGDISIASRDLRDQQIYGNLGPGDTCVYGTGATGLGQARVMVSGNDGSVTLSTTTDGSNGVGKNTDAGVGVYLRIDTDKLQFTAPWGSLVFDRTGFHIKTSSGAGFDLINMPASLVAFGGNCQAKITASQITMDAPTVFLGPSVTNGGSAYMPAVYGVVPGPVGTPILGVGVGAVTVAASASTKVYLAI